VSADGEFYVWKKKYGGLILTELRELRQLREENSKLKRLVADLTLDRHVLPEIVNRIRSERGAMSGRRPVEPGHV
jgi:putative transposase